MTVFWKLRGKSFTAGIKKKPQEVDNKKLVNIINRIETALGIFLLVKKSRIGERIKERKIAKKKGKRTAFACCKTTPTAKITRIIRAAAITLLPCISPS